MTLRATVDFLLHDWLKVSELNQRPRFADHTRETFDAVLDTCERIARDKFAPFNRTVDVQEPAFDGEKVILPDCTLQAHQAYAGCSRFVDKEPAQASNMHGPADARGRFLACLAPSLPRTLSARMVFSSNIFLFVFLPLFLASYYLTPWRWKRAST